MLSKTMEKALNDQVHWELYSAYLYVSMATYFEDKGLMGFANWMHVQDQEEKFHAQKFYNYIVERGGRVILQAIDTPPHDWASALAVFEEALAHEEGVTARIYKLWTWHWRKRTTERPRSSSGSSTSRWRKRPTWPMSSPS